GPEWHQLRGQRLQQGLRAASLRHQRTAGATDRQSAQLDLLCSVDDRSTRTDPGRDVHGMESGDVAEVEEPNHRVVIADEALSYVLCPLSAVRYLRYASGIRHRTTRIGHRTTRIGHP